MYITCEQCSTIFRLDEKRLKPAGSKVRCCQCRSVFVAWPPAPAESGPAGTRGMEDAAAQFAAPSLAQPHEDTFDQELEGIDLAELDSILDQDRSNAPSASGAALDDGPAALAIEEPDELDDSDLDLDFESELALDDDSPADSAVHAAGEAPDEDLELDMDFELDPTIASGAPESQAAAQPVEDELEMDFELGDDLDQQPEAQVQEASLDIQDENIDAVLDDFEDVLNETESTEGEASPASAEGGVAEVEEEIDLSDLEDVLETPEESGSAAEDVDLGDIEAALDAPAMEEEVAGEDDFDIDLSDLDMDLDDLDSSEFEDDGAQAGLSLDDDDTIAAEEPPVSEPDEAPVATDETQDEEDFDLSDLDGLMELDEEEGAAEEEASPGDEDTELSLDDDLSLEEEVAPSAGPEAVEEAAPSDAQEDEEVFDLSDLDGLMDLDEEEEPAGEEAVAGGGGAELSLDDDLSLDLEEEPVAETGETADAAAGDDMLQEEQADELDLSDLGGLDTMLDDDQQSEDDGLEDLELSLDDGAEEGMAEDQELTLEMEDDTRQAPEPGPGDDELDLGGIDNLLEDEGEGADDSELEDLELSLDDGSEPSDEEDTGEGSAEDDEELDLSDLEQMLENETLVPESVPQGQESELNLTGKDEKFADSEADSLGLDQGAELDLSEIEAAIDSAEEETDAGDDEELDLELDLESPAAEELEPQESLDDELDLELEMESGAAGGAEPEDDDREAIDLSDMDLSLEDEKPEGEGEVVDAGDIELEFQIEDEMEPATIDSAETMPGDIATASATKTTVPADDDTSLIEEAFAGQPEAGKEAEKVKPEKKKKQKKKGSSTGLIVILILVLLGAGGFFGYQYAVEHNIEIPYLNKLIHPQPQDPSGTAKLTTMDINSKFIDNKDGGRIFVVTGKVRNGYPVPCNKIQLQGKLYTKGKVLAKTELAYAGVVINDLELGGQSVAQIKQRLKTGGGQTAELVVNAGQTLPFMVVFSDLPDDLDEFAIELLNSTKVQ